MEAESFFERWSKRNADAAAERELARVPEQPLPAPTLDDVALLTPDADFSRFVAPGVDETVRRSAMKKLFADPHFNVMDGLDVYIEDYHSFTPIPAAVLAALHHAQSLLDPFALLTPPDEAAQDTAAEKGVAVTDHPPKEEAPNDGNPVQSL
ncbi:DUF3306 domain-containing protein [Noviherbaspirillum denitrificans]|uniref:DUF3306 domain-containing protein n=1 Tax=Noviherbaspirillum denitrificans TaxID=1968433 RepID=A0A254TFB6_9BURK|nr:DUF3306 domain-containing protein [Noviherbaspirillum denitrificans]OWW21331.1 hypothetical protein AYR66_19470 [Noviherbaspirillum denitrificans]